MSNEGPQPKETPLEREARQVAAAIDAEEIEWAKAGMNPDAVKFNMFLNVCRIDTLVKLVVDAGLTTQEKLDLEFKKQILSLYQTIRTTHQEEVNKPDIFGLDGRRLN